MLLQPPIVRVLVRVITIFGFPVNTSLLASENGVDTISVVIGNVCPRIGIDARVLRAMREGNVSETEVDSVDTFDSWVEVENSRYFSFASFSRGHAD